MLVADIAEKIPGVTPTTRENVGVSISVVKDVLVDLRYASESTEIPLNCSSNSLLHVFSTSNSGAHSVFGPEANCVPSCAETEFAFMADPHVEDVFCPGLSEFFETS